ncbi:O-antigen ligase family protein [Patescibacteria group bacterium]
MKDENRSSILPLNAKKGRGRVIEYLFYGFVFLLPWQTVFLVREIFVGGEKWQYGTVGVYFSDFILVFLLVLIVVEKLKGILMCHFDRIRLGGEWRNLNITKSWGYIQGEISRLRFVLRRGEPFNCTRDDNANGLVILFLLWMVLSIVWADDRFLALYFSFKMFLGVGLFFAVQKIKFDFRKLIFVLLVGAVIQSGLGTWQYLSQETFSSKWLGMSEYVASIGGVSVLENETGRWLRAYGGFSHPNMFGGYLALVMLVISGLNLKFKIFNLNSILNYEIFKRKKYISYGLLIVGCCLLITGLLFSFSRSAWLALAIIVIFQFKFFNLKSIFSGEIFKQKNKKNDKVGWFVAMIVFATLIVGINHENFFSRFDGSARLEQKSVMDRVSYVTEASQVIQDDFFVGVGAGNYTLEVMKNDRLQRPVWEYQPVHNIFLLIFSELGLVGFVLFSTMLVLLIMKTGIKALPIFVALFIFMMLDHWLWTSHYGMLFFWLILGLVYIDNKKMS